MKEIIELTLHPETEKLPDGLHMDYRGYRFEYPFRCLCCGQQITSRQFAFGRACGYCDSGKCIKGMGYESGHGNLWEVLPDNTISPKTGWQ